jgi:dihydrofolate reductase
MPCGFFSPRTLDEMKLTVVENITLDGVMQSPARPDEDTRGGFSQGGWGIAYSDEVAAAEMAKRMARPGSLVLGRRTYEDLYEVWPKRTNNPYTERLNKTRKYVASRTLREPLPWENSVLLAGDACDAIAELKRKGDEDLGIIGSGELVASLMARDLIDEFVLLITPLVLGAGRRLFNGGTAARLTLLDTVTTTKGVIIATYATQR